MLVHSRLLAGLAVLMAAVCPAAQNGIHGLEFLGQTDTTAALNISADGRVVVGYSQPVGSPFNSNRTPVRWVLDAMFGIEDLGRPPGWTDGVASETSSDGSVVLGSRHVSDAFFRWSNPGPSNALTTGMPWAAARPRALSPDGSFIVGHADIPGVGTRATRWDGISAPTLLPAPVGAAATRALCFSGSGDVFGTVSHPGQPDRITRWSADGAVDMLAELPTGPSVWSGPFGASSDGLTIFGETDYISNFVRNEAWVWSMSTGRVVIPPLPGMFSSVATAMSGDGALVAGWSADPQNIVLIPIIWTRTMGTVTLDQFLMSLGVEVGGWSLGPVFGISADGLRLVASGTGPSGRPQAVFIQVPNPPTAWILAGALGAAFARKRASVRLQSHRP